MRSSRIPRTYRKAHEAPLRKVTRRSSSECARPVTEPRHAATLRRAFSRERERPVEDSELRRLASTPVGRRWVLKAGGAALLAALLGGRSLPGPARPARREPGAPRRATGNRAERQAAAEAEAAEAAQEPRLGAPRAARHLHRAAEGAQVPQPVPARGWPGLPGPQADGGREARAEAEGRHLRGHRHPPPDARRATGAPLDARPEHPHGPGRAPARRPHRPALAAHLGAARTGDAGRPGRHQAPRGRPGSSTSTPAGARPSASARRSGTPSTA